MLPNQDNPQPGADFVRLQIAVIEEKIAFFEMVEREARLIISRSDTNLAELKQILKQLEVE